VTEIEIGKGKRGRTAYSFDDIAIVPSRRTRDPEEVSVAWQIDAYRFEIPVLAAPMDSVVSPATAIAIGKLGGVGVLNLEGIWTRYEDPEPLLAEIAGLGDAEVTRRMQEIYEAPIQPSWSRPGSPRCVPRESPWRPLCRRNGPRSCGRRWSTQVWTSS
jgi:IMP dehydrogenase